MKEQSKINFKSIFQKHKLFWCGFLVTAITYVVMFGMKGFYPLGDHFLVSGDTLTQYIPFLQEFKRKLLNGESLSYAYSGAGGMNFYSIYAYYLSNPLNYLWLLFDGASAYKILNILFVIKALLAYCTMYVCLANRPNVKKSRCEVVFAYAYAVSNMILSLSSVFVYVDCFVLLPLLVLGLEKFVYQNKKGLFLISLIALLLSNYYIGFMACIFVALYYLTLTFENAGACLKKGIQMIGYSVIAVMTTSYVWIPVVYDVKHKLYAGDKFEGVGFFDNWISVLNQLLFYESPIYSGSGSDNLGEANLYVGIFTLLLVISYFFNRKVAMSKRVRTLGLFVLLLLSVNEKLLSYVFHLFHYTRGFANRQCIFLLLFALFVGCEQFAYLIELEKEAMKRYRIVHIVSAVLFITLVFVCLNASTIETSILPYIHSFDLIVVYTILLCLGRKKEEQTRFAVILSVLFLLEAGINAVHGAKVFRDCKVSEYESLAGQTDFVESFDGSDEELPLRVNKSGLTQYGNLGYLLGYSGLEVHSNNVSKKYSDAMSNLGSTVETGAVRDVSLDPLTSTVFGAKYIISGEDTIQGGKKEFSQYKKVKQGEIDVYENEWATTPVIVAKGDFSNYNALAEKYAEGIILHYNDIKNALSEELTGIGGLFDWADVELVGTDSANCAASFVDNHVVLSNMQGSTDDSSVSYDPKEKSYVTLQCEVKEPGAIYTNLVSTDYVGDFEKGDTFSYTIEVDPADFNVLGLFMFDVTFSKWNAENWQQVCEIVQQNQMKVTSHKDGEIVGTLNSDSDCTVFTSFAYDDNWKIMVDGKSVKTGEAMDGMLGFKMPAGEHEVKLRYIVEGRLLGALLSVISVLVLIYVFCFYKRAYKEQKHVEEK